MIPSGFIFLALCFNVGGSTLYARMALADKVRPQLVTFALWSFAPLLAFAAQVSKGAGVISLVTLVVGVNPAIILLISLRSSKAHWSISKFDVACGISSLAGILAWWYFRDADYAIVLAIVSDALAALPTYRKSISNPESESPILYACTGISAGLVLLTIQDWQLDHYAFAAYLFVSSFSLALMLVIAGMRRGSP